jgi:predicted transcriptional regulator
MAPSTRSRAIAPARTYHSSPALRQVTFAAGPARREKAISDNKPDQNSSRNPLRNHGSASKRRSLASSTGRTLKQETLTQMASFSFLMAEDHDGKDLRLDLEEQENEEDRVERPRKRRKTWGDTPDLAVSGTRTSSRARKAKASQMSTTPSVGATKGKRPTHKTQTLTQMLPDVGDSLRVLVDDSEADEEGGIDWGLEAASVSLSPARSAAEGQIRDVQPKQKRTPPVDEAVQIRKKPLIPQTPVKTVRQDQTGPAEPPSLTTSPPKSGRLQEVDKSPLKELSTNARIEPAVGREKKPRDFVVQDSYSIGIPCSSAGSALSSFSPVNSTKTYVSNAAQPETKPLEVTGSMKGVERMTGDRKKTEIPDSDDELLSLGPTPKKARRAAERSPLTELTQGTKEVFPLDSVSEEVLVSGPAPDIQSTPQLEGEEDDEDEEAPGTPTPLPRRVTAADALEVHESSLMEPKALPRHAEGGESLLQRSQVETQPLARSEKTKCTEHPVLSLAPDTPSKPGRATQYPYSQTQGWESQRVPHKVIQSMRPQTDRSDIILSVNPDAVAAIAAGTKTHEFRGYKLPTTVSRIWIYVTRPVCELQYMAIIGPAIEAGWMRPEQVDCGDGNREFNEGKGLKYAHELKQVYQLNNPVPVTRMKENGWMQAPPQKYIYVPPAVVGQLLSNLRCALFEEEGDGYITDAGPEDVQPVAAAPVTISQEVEEQIRTDIAHSTQVRSGPAEQPNSSQSIVPSSQVPLPDEVVSVSSGSRPSSDGVFTKPPLPPRRQIPSQWSTQAVSASQSGSQIRSQPLTAATPSQQLPHWPRPNGPAAVRPSQATTASALSSPARTVVTISPEKSLPQSSPVSGVADDKLEVESQTYDASGVKRSPAPGSSLPAVLPESLIIAATRRPDVSWDSDEDL